MKKLFLILNNGQVVLGEEERKIDGERFSSIDVLQPFTFSLLLSLQNHFPNC
jgi:hypothetical protein